MTIYQEKEFYAKDKQDYIIKNNKEFLTWLQRTIEGGYSHHHKLSSMQGLINSITYWYEIKYPEIQMGYLKDTPHARSFAMINRLSSVMTTEQLLYRLPLDQHSLIDCNFFCQYGYLNPKNKYEIKQDEAFKEIHVNSSLDYCIDEDGEVIKITGINRYDEENTYNADELLELLRIVDKYDLTNLENDIYNYYSDIELRHRLLQLTALSIVYSKNTNPERGYKRSKLFIKEFNKDLGLLLSSDEIDNIMETIDKKSIFNQKVLRK